VRVKFLLCNHHKFDFGGWFIRRFDRSKFSHAAIELEITQPVVYEFVMPKSKKTFKIDWAKGYKVERSYDFVVPTHLQFDVLQWLNAHVGIRYSMTQIGWIALCNAISLIDKNFNWVPINQSKAMICTELVSRFMERFMTIKFKESHDKISLKDIYNYCIELENNPGWKKK
jgi:hypothetical protein